MEAFIDFFVQWGYLGLIISAFVAGSIIPFSSEVVLVILLQMGLDPVICIVLATVSNTAGGMTCYWMGHLGKTEWIHKYLGVDDAKMAKVTKFLHGRGAIMGLFTVLPYIGEAIAVVMGLMRSNVWLTTASMFVGKLLRYVAVYVAFRFAIALF